MFCRRKSTWSNLKGLSRKNKEAIVCKLNKAIYGLKQEPRVWFEKLKSTLINFGYTSTKYDNSLFTKFSKLATTYVLIYVDDFIITSTSDIENKKLIEHLNKEFSVKELGCLNYFLGTEVKRMSNEKKFLSQEKSGLLVKARMDKENSLSTPMTHNTYLSKHKEEEISNDKQYKNIVGEL